MTKQDELIAILDSILSGRRDEEDIAKLRQSLSMAGSVLQWVSQDGKFNTNIGQITGGEIHLGDRIYQGDSAETIRKVFQEVLQRQSQPPDIDWYAVCKKNLQKLQKLTSNPLTQKQDLTVNAVYVPLGLVEREKKKKSERQEDINPEQGSELYKETKITKTFEHHDFLEEVLRQGKSHSQGKRIAIIGEPGAGKTTLLQRIANWVSEEIKESIVIWLSLAGLGDKKLDDYLSKDWLSDNALDVYKDTPQLQNAFNQGRVWLLLDGLDEMPAPPGGDSLEAIAQQLKVGWISEARVVLTCRLNLWDSNSKRKDLYEFDIFRTLDFSYPKQVEQFINQWFRATDNLEQAQQLCSALKEQNKGRLRDLVRNPLRLTLLCEIWGGKQEQGELPDTKAKLYQEFVDYHYSYKFNTTDREREELNRVLGELAKWAIEQPKFRFRIRLDQIPKHLKQQLGYKDEKGSLLGLALQLGWLNNVGVAAENSDVEVYAFFHASFQEYFAAQAIDNWHFFFDHKRRNPAQGTYLVFDSQWKEPILFWLGRDDIEKEHKNAFIRTLVNFRDGWQGYYQHQAYFLAAAGIVEFRDCAMVNEIVGVIVEWSLGQVLSTAANLHPLVIDGARVALKETNRKAAISHLIKTIKSTPKSKFTYPRELVPMGITYSWRQKTIEKIHPKYWAAIRILGEIGTESPEAVATLDKLIKDKDTTDDFTRLIAAESLRKLDLGNLQAKNARQKAVESLREIDFSESAKIEELIALLETTTDEPIRQIVSDIFKRNLKKLGHKKLINIIDIVVVTQRQSIRKIAIYILTKILLYLEITPKSKKEDKEKKKVDEKKEDEKNKIMQGLKELINEAPDNFIQNKALSILESIDEKQAKEYKEKIQNQKKEVHKITEDIEKLEIEELLRFVKYTNKIKTIDLKKYSVKEPVPKEDGYIQVKKAINRILSKISPDNYQEIINVLIYIIKTCGNERIRREAITVCQKAIEVLEEINVGKPEEVTKLLTDLIKETREVEIRLTAARSLWRIDPGNCQALNSLIKTDDYETLYRLAQGLAYPEFHRAWRQSSLLRYLMWLLACLNVV